MHRPGGLSEVRRKLISEVDERAGHGAYARALYWSALEKIEYLEVDPFEETS
jgi:hypothetical protein